MAAMTAAVGLYHCLELNPPWAPATVPTPLIIYGASGAVGAFAVKLACRSNIHPIIAIAGSGRAMVDKIIDPSKGDIVVDYRSGPEHIARSVQQALKGQGIKSVAHAFDCISEKGSPELLSKILDPSGQATFVLPEKDYSAVQETIRTSLTYVGYVHTGPFPIDPKKGLRFNPGGRGDDFGFIYSNLFTKGLRDGWLTGHPYEVIPNGLKGLPTALRSLKEGLASAVKYVIRIEETN